MDAIINKKRKFHLKVEKNNNYFSKAYCFL